MGYTKNHAYILLEETENRISKYSTCHRVLYAMKKKEKESRIRKISSARVSRGCVLYVVA